MVTKMKAKDKKSI